MAGGWIDVHGHFNVIALRPPGYDPKNKWEFTPETSLDFMDRTGVAAPALPARHASAMDGASAATILRRGRCSGRPTDGRGDSAKICTPRNSVM